MSTILWKGITFGPIHSRRVGTSLGINLMPSGGKVCSFDCVYCECGWNRDGRKCLNIPTYETVVEAMESKFRDLAEQKVKVDSISFTGNGEPTLHPDFSKIIDIVIDLRDRFLPGAMISVFSNATMIGYPEIRMALFRVENPILKLDAALDELVLNINQPQGTYNVADVVENLRLFNGDFVMQTMFLKGCTEKGSVDNTIDENVFAWRDIVLSLRPRKVMVYSFERETPAHGLVKASTSEMERISAPLIAAGIDVQINA